MLHLILLFLLIVHQSCSFQSRINFRKVNRVSEMSSTKNSILVTGLGFNDGDEFTLSLIHESNKWDSIVLGTRNRNKAHKRFLSRTARYSGLLNVLQFEQMNGNTDTGLGLDLESVDLVASSDIDKDQLLEDAEDKDGTSSSSTTKESISSAQLLRLAPSAWVAFGVPSSSIARLAQLAIKHNIPRVIFTVSSSTNGVGIRESAPELAKAEEAFRAAGDAFSFIGVLHGDVVDGCENNPYEIVNATTTLPCDLSFTRGTNRGADPNSNHDSVKNSNSNSKSNSFVHKGVLGRVVSELLFMNNSRNIICGVASAASDSFAAAYLNILRSTGLTRSQEVQKMLSGGLQRVAARTAAGIDEREARTREKEKEMENAAAAVTKGNASNNADSNEDELDVLRLKMTTTVMRREARTKQILQGVWSQLDSRMLTKSTSKAEFFNLNAALAADLANKEEDEANAAFSESKEKVLPSLRDSNRHQYSKLLALETKELRTQQALSETWLKYIYLLLETASRASREEGKELSELDSFAQIRALRSAANLLRSRVGLSQYPVIYDPLDAEAIVKRIEEEDIDHMASDLQLTVIDLVSEQLEARYGALLVSSGALRGAQELLEKAKKTLAVLLPSMTPSPHILY